MFSGTAQLQMDAGEAAPWKGRPTSSAETVPTAACASTGARPVPNLSEKALASVLLV